MAVSIKSNPYYFTFITSAFISIISHFIKNLDEILDIDCGGACMINSFNEIIFSLESLVNSFILFIICFLIIQIRIEKSFLSNIKKIYNDLDYKKDSIISTSTFVTDMDTIIEDVGDYVKVKKGEIESLKKAEEYRKEFVGNVAHELKTPLFSIQGYISNLLDGAFRDKELLKKYLKKADKSIERLTFIVKDLDLITQIESATLVLKKTSFDIVKLVEEIIDHLEINATKKKIKLVFDKDYNLPITVFADKTRIEQVLTNLISNSINYGSDKGTTEISFDISSDKLLIKVTDNGDGISEENMPRLFERFFRVDISRSREHGGSGLGLAIVKHIIDAHNENIFVQSNPGIGSEFSFTLQKK
tara:strand:- start:103 stop:1182 length:1080 start_codon:yes stop_codon:yes gene_type:complete